jgi:tetratricopeptide (TPR) repeat protein
MRVNTSELDDLWDYSDPAASEARFRQRLSKRGAEADPAQLAETRTQLARSQGLQRHFDEAHATLDGVEAQLAEMPARVQVRYALERGRVFNSSGQPERSVALFESAWEQARAAGEDGLAVDAAHMLGIAEPGERGMTWNLKALELARASAQPAANRWQGPLYNNIGWSYFDAGQYEDALGMFEQALVWQQANGPEKEIRIARWCIARDLRALGRVAEALATQQALFAEYQQSLGEDGYVSEELGECLLALGHPAEARPHFQRAYTLLSQNLWLPEREPDRLARLQRLGSDDSTP